MKGGGFRRLFEDKPVLLRLHRHRHAAVDRYVARIRPAARCRSARRSAAIFSVAGAAGRVAAIEGDLSDPHNGGRSVRIVALRGRRAGRLQAEGSAARRRLARLDRTVEPGRCPGGAEGGARHRARRLWLDRIHRLTRDAPTQEGCRRFFRRAGAWLALLHCFAATDMHQENMIAAGDHPVPIDLETILQADGRGAQIRGSRGAGLRCRHRNRSPTRS